MASPPLEELRMSSKNNEPQAIEHLPEDHEHERTKKESLKHRAHAVGLDPKYASENDVINRENAK